MTEVGAEDERSDDTGLTRRYWIALGVVVLGGLSLRVLNVLVLRPTVNHPSASDYYINGDAFYYHWQGIALGGGHFFVNPVKYAFYGAIEPSAAHPPLYSLYLGAWSALGLDGVTAHRLESCLLGAVTVGLIGLLVQRIAGNRAGLIAAVLAAAYPQLWINDGMLLSETAAQFATALALLAAYWFWSVPSLRRGALFGAAVGVAALSRSEMLLFFPMVVIPFALLAHRREAWKPKVQVVVAALGAGALVMAPWVVFNMSRFREPTYLSTGQWSAISAGTCDEVFYGAYIGYYANCYRDYPDKTKEPRAYERYKHFDESERDVRSVGRHRSPRGFARHYLDEHTGRLPVVVGARVGRLWGVFKPGQTTFLDWWLEGRGKMQSWAGLIMFYALWPFAIYGVVAMRRRRVPILPMVSLAVIATLAAAITFGVTRYRATFEVALVATAAVGVDAVWRRVAARRASGEATT